MNVGTRQVINQCRIEMNTTKLIDTESHSHDSILHTGNDDRLEEFILHSSDLKEKLDNRNYELVCVPERNFTAKF